MMETIAELTLQSSLFHIYNSIVRASPASRENVLDYFAHVVRLNKKRAGMRVSCSSNDKADERSTTERSLRTAS
jgi:hypothetical protein